MTWTPLAQNGTLTTVGGSSVWTPAQTCGPAKNQPCFLGSLTANGTYTTPAYPNYSLRSAAQLCSQPGPSFTCSQDGVLFFQVGDFPGVGRAFASAPGTNPALGDNCGQATCFSLGQPADVQLPMWILTNFNNFMYAGSGSPAITGTQQHYGVWSTNGAGTPPYTWNPIIMNGGYAQNLIADFAMSMQIFSDPTYCPGFRRAADVYMSAPTGPTRWCASIPIPPAKCNVDATDSWDLLVVATRAPFRPASPAPASISRH